MRRDNQHIKDIRLTDIRYHTFDESIIKYDDEELVIIADLREIPELASQKLAFNMVAVCMSGRMQFDVSGTTTTIQALQVVVCQSHAVLSNFMVSPDFECMIMCISDRLLRSTLSTQMLQWNKMLYRQRCIILNVPQDRTGIYRELRYQWTRNDSPLRREILVSLLRVALLELCQVLMQREAEQPAPLVENSSRMEILFHQFLENIARRHIKKRPVGEYAEELCITPKYLSTVCRTVSDKTPIEWISEYVVEDIIYYLKHTSLSASQIAAEMGFANASFFGKYVREHLGVSPNEYRKKIT